MKGRTINKFEYVSYCRNGNICRNQSGKRVVKSSETERKERMDTSSLMEQILSGENLKEAYLQVIRNKGAEGVDGMKYTDLKEHLIKNGEEIKE